MFLKQEIKPKSDLIHCPITKEIIRHPVLASDGRHYELRALEEWIKINKQSPIDFLPITTLIYDILLKNELDGYNPPNRYEDYEKEPLLSTLMAKINPEQQSPLMHYPKRVASSVNLFLSLYLVLFEALFEPIERSNLLFLIFLIGFSDYTIRSFSNNRYSLFTVLDLVTESIHTAYSAKAKLSSNMS